MYSKSRFLSRLIFTPVRDHSKRRFQPSLYTTDSLEQRALLSVTIQSIERQSSAGLLNGPIHDQIPLTPQPGGLLTGTAESFVGYPYQNIMIGGMGLQIQFQSSNPATIGARPAIVQVNWGDSTPELQQSFNPTFQSVYRTSPTGQANWSDSLILPHVYSKTGTFQVIVQVSEVPLPDGSPVLMSEAQITLQVGHIIEGSQGLFLRGTNGVDTVNIGSSSGGSVLVQASFDGSLISRTTTAANIYVDALAGNDVILADPANTQNLFFDGGNGADELLSGAGLAQLLGGPDDDLMTSGTGPSIMFGAGGNDTMTGGPMPDNIDGGTGNDLIYGLAGDDTLFGDQGNDTLHGGLGSDLLMGGLGQDSLLGEEGNDVLIGGFSNVATPNFPANSIAQAWAASNLRQVSRIVKSPVVQSPTDLSTVAFTKLANGSTRVARMHFGPLVANDGTPDILNGGTGHNAIAAHRTTPRTADVIIPVAHQDGQNSLILLSDHTVRGVTKSIPFTAYISSNGLDMIPNPTRTTYVLYRTVPDGVNLFRTIPFDGVYSTEFQAYYGKPAPAEFRVDNMKDFNRFLPLDVYWAGFNRPFLAYGTSFGGVIVTSSDPFDPKNLYNETNATDSAFHKEFIYLFQASPKEQYPTPYQPYTYDPMRRLFYRTSLI